MPPVLNPRGLPQMVPGWMQKAVGWWHTVGCWMISLPSSFILSSPELTGWCLQHSNLFTVLCLLNIPTAASVACQIPCWKQSFNLLSWPCVLEHSCSPTSMVWYWHLPTSLLIYCLLLGESYPAFRTRILCELSWTPSKSVAVPYFPPHLLPVSLPTLVTFYRGALFVWLSLLPDCRIVGFSRAGPCLGSFLFLHVQVQSLSHRRQSYTCLELINKER